MKPGKSINQQDFLISNENKFASGPMEELRRQVVTCPRCRLAETRTHAVYGEGDYQADLMFVGEAPGAAEDATGMPFVGRAGQILTKELAVHGISRGEVFISNIVKCRPPKNRDPKPDEIAACSPYLSRQIEMIQPAIICALGRYAAAALLQRPVKITLEHGQWMEYHGAAFLIAIHPSASVRSKEFRSQFESDIAAIAKRYRELPGRGVVYIGEK